MLKSRLHHCPVILLSALVFFWSFAGPAYARQGQEALGAGAKAQWSGSAYEGDRPQENQRDTSLESRHKWDQTIEQKIKSLRNDIAAAKRELKVIRGMLNHLSVRAELDEQASRKTRQHGEKLLRSGGEFLGQKWWIDENHLMWWDGKPYVPFGGFGIEPGNEFGLNTFNLWVDFDPFIGKPHYTRAQHKEDIAKKLDAISKSRGTCIVQFSMALPHIPEGPEPGMNWREPKGGIDGSRLADPKVKRAILDVWGYYAPAVRKPCVRAIVLWNEINVWRWAEHMSAKQYGLVLGDYARQVKRIVGDLPVCFKTAGTWNAEAVLASAAAADGLGFDVWFHDANDSHARRQIEQALRMLEERQKKTTWFFIAEGGRGIAEGGTDDAKDVKSYWDNWPPFRSKQETQGILKAYALSGVKGFIYNGPASDPASNYHNSYRWFGQLQKETVDLMTNLFHRR